VTGIELTARPGTARDRFTAAGIALAIAGVALGGALTPSPTPTPPREQTLALPSEVDERLVPVADLPSPVPPRDTPLLWFGYGCGWIPGGVIFYTTGGTLAVDTNTCDRPPGGR
jgi:hypothetical protein